MNNYFSARLSDFGLDEGDEYLFSPSFPRYQEKY
jgi:hypothetical protein